MSLDLVSERVCYVHCNFCNTILAVQQSLFLFLFLFLYMYLSLFHNQKNLSFLSHTSPESWIGHDIYHVQSSVSFWWCKIYYYYYLVIYRKFSWKDWWWEYTSKDLGYATQFFVMSLYSVIISFQTHYGIREFPWSHSEIAKESKSMSYFMTNSNLSLPQKLQHESKRWVIPVSSSWWGNSYGGYKLFVGIMK